MVKPLVGGFSRETSPPEASRARPPAGYRRVQFRTSLPHAPTASAPPRVRLPVAAPEDRPSVPAHPRPSAHGTHPCRTRGRVRHRHQAYRDAAAPFASRTGDGGKPSPLAGRVPAGDLVMLEQPGKERPTGEFELWSRPGGGRARSGRPRSRRVRGPGRRSPWPRTWRGRGRGRSAGSRRLPGRCAGCGGSSRKSFGTAAGPRGRVRGRFRGPGAATPPVRPVSAADAERTATEAHRSVRLTPSARHACGFPFPPTACGTLWRGLALPNGMPPVRSSVRTL